MYTREEFEKLRIKKAAEMVRDRGLLQDARQVLYRADQYYWIHQTTWFGEPILQVPQDMFALQEIIYATRPKYIIEVGTAWGGALLFYSTLMEVLGGEKIVAIDIYIPDDLKERIGSFGNLSERIVWINGSSVEAETLRAIKEVVGQSRETMVVLDSKHTHDHVLQELQLYSPLVGKGHYLICGDTVLEEFPADQNRDRPWGRGNNPMTALREFQNQNHRFEVDEHLDNKLLITCNPRGYLKCIKD